MKHLMMRHLSCLWGTLALCLVQQLHLFPQNIPTVMDQQVPQGECITNAFGQQLCGYNCAQNAFGKMACADWPGGICTVNAFGTITCGPPAPPNWVFLYRRGRGGNVQKINQCDKIRDVRQLARQEELDDEPFAVLESRYCGS